MAIPISPEILYHSRRKRDTDNTTSTGYNSDLYEYADPASVEDVIFDLKWPTATGITEKQARAYCLRVLWLESPLRSVCAQTLTGSDIQDVVSKCVLDVMVCLLYFW